MTASAAAPVAAQAPRAWKVVERENAYRKVWILPEIGGKIWNAVDKRTGRSFIYFNLAVKFRDIAMRGPWTSGGIEANYGIIGHTPNVATPVDYVTRTNPDDSVSCIIGALDLLTRTPWRLEIRLGRDDAAFSTTSFWYNASDLEQPYYSWMNAGIPVRGNLQFAYPGTSYLGHDGEHAPWPVDTTGRDLSWYEHNDFGGYKSCHVFGRESDFFGAYWHDDDVGMVRYAPRDDKIGKKIWIWGLSRQGMIWEQLLTDSDGQYAEVQSGPLFNQTAEHCPPRREIRCVGAPARPVGRLALRPARHPGGGPAPPPLSPPRPGHVSGCRRPSCAPRENVYCLPSPTHPLSTFIVRNHEKAAAPSLGALGLRRSEGSSPGGHCRHGAGRAHGR